MDDAIANLGLIFAATVVCYLAIDRNSAIYLSH